MFTELVGITDKTAFVVTEDGLYLKVLCTPCESGALSFPSNDEQQS